MSCSRGALQIFNLEDLNGKINWSQVRILAILFVPK